MNKRKMEEFRKQFLELLVALLANGFSLQESMAVMLRSGQFPEAQLQSFVTGLTSGKTLAACFLGLGFSVAQTTQIQLAEAHGNLPQTLQTILQHMQIFEKQQKELRKVAAYPALLLIFVFALLIGMRLFLLPQLLVSGMIDSRHWSLLFLQFGPYAIAGGFLLLLSSFLIGYSYFKRRKILARGRFLARLPWFGSLYVLYQTSYFSLEWGRLFKQGMEAHQILLHMSSVNDAALLAAVAEEVHAGLARGLPLAQQLAAYPFLTPEFPLIIYQGEVKGKLGDELMLYSQLLVTKLVARIEKSIQWVQPIIFLFVAVLIMAIYVAMFLPMYGNLGGVMK